MVDCQADGGDAAFDPLGGHRIWAADLGHNARIIGVTQRDTTMLRAGYEAYVHANRFPLRADVTPAAVIVRPPRPRSTSG
ncbi:hypothetical protein NBRGN_054_00040 [Nocardia brasiliensis NBRC 14402]|nr:hypothetical protein NBRGN_054_00040 [Nocardia brasiliensis NBRC 14402]